jgi:hypothetical protein
MSRKQILSPGNLLGISVIGVVQFLAASCLAETAFLSEEQRALMDAQFRVHMNYFRSSDVVTSSGLPTSAYRHGARALYVSSGPAQWGYAIQAWIAAAERNIWSSNQATLQIRTALRTVQLMQIDSSQNHRGLFYASYVLRDWLGNDLSAPHHDDNLRISSLDNALFYASLTITKGWARRIGDGHLQNLADSVMRRMQLRAFLVPHASGPRLARVLDADTGLGMTDHWDVYADEGGVVAWIAYLSGAIQFDEYSLITRAQSREPRFWQSCSDIRHLVREAPFYNAMSVWSLRSLAGFPIGSFEGPLGIQSYFSPDSFVPAVRTHLAYGKCLGVDYPAFSDALTQTANGIPLVDRFTPANLNYEAPETLPGHVTPHAFFVPFAAGSDLDPDLRNQLFAYIKQLTVDSAGYYHGAGVTPFGFEVLASPFRDTAYLGADDGRGIFETLSHAYATLSMFTCLQLDEGKPTFYTLAAGVPGYVISVAQILSSLYGITEYTPNPVGVSITPVIGIYRFGSANTAYPPERTITIDKDHLRLGQNVLVLELANDKQPNPWLLWDHLSLHTDTGLLVWILGEDESSPTIDPTAWDEFDLVAPFVTDFHADHQPVQEFPGQLGAGSVPRLTIRFNLNGQESRRDVSLRLDTLLATHDDTPYFEMMISVNP